ncbi:hypothetical protein [Mesorhizobium sp.]|uniref:hypothetical protein n=1 Tax=Mesorhizobium sp. TaxID=1871066 RepID=UPI001227CE7F|nr:hypothetical protein [Mesorhizobium sp.]TIX28793.1 MAG: hypothetical protein E5V35_00080 [Mesorhizobium sp.]
MTDRPILFSAPMVLALLAGTKFQTRRVLNPQPEHLQVYDWKGKRLHDSEYRHWCWKGHVGADNWDDITKQLSPFLPYAVGDRLYVREAWRTSMAYDDISPSDMGGEEPIQYIADSAVETFGWRGVAVPGRFRQGMHMPRWASRLTLTVAEVRVQRLQDITEADAIAEGTECLAPPSGTFAGGWRVYGTPPEAGGMWSSARDSYHNLWDTLNADRGYSWAEDPWIVAVTFSVIKQNIDQVKP